MSGDSNRRIDWLLAAIVALSAFLNLYGIWNDDYSNTYYTAAVTSMVQSWHNFFFASFDPGGFVTVDKPPVALWIQAAFAYLLGVQGSSVILPQSLANIGAVLLIYFLVKPTFGTMAARGSALVMACSPIAVVISRSNNLDSTLVFALLAGVWMLLKGLRSNRPGWILGAFAMIGVGFNIKMLQAYLVVPAFYIAVLLMLPGQYSWGSVPFTQYLQGWKRKALILAAATAVLVTVSLSWAVMVDSIPASERPYVGGSDTNSELELALGYNGIQRLTGENGNGQQGPGQGGDGGMFGTGSPGVLRLFQSELSGQISWLLPFALLASMAMLSGIKRHQPLDDRQNETLFWLAWLIPGMAFFSVAMFFHQYYLTMLAAPVAVLAGTGWVELRRLHRRQEGWKRLGLPAAISLTTAFELYIMWPYQSTIGFGWIIGIGAAGMLVCRALIVRSWQVRWSSAIAVASLLVILAGPLYWSVTPIAYGINSAIPQAGPGGGMGGGPHGGNDNSGPPDINAGGPPIGSPGQFNGDPGQFEGTPGQPPEMDENDAGPGGHNNSGGPGGPGNGGGPGGSVDAELLEYLISHNTGEKYIFACADANTAGSWIIKTGRPVMAMGGFGGSDPILTVESLQAMVEKGEIKYFLISGGGDGHGGRQSDVTEWIIANSTAITSDEWNAGDGGPGGGQTLYLINL